MSGNPVVPEGFIERNKLDEVYEALSHVRRRRLVEALLEQDAAGVDVAHVPDSVHDGAADAESLQLYHVHLPKLEAAGFIEWDGGNQVARGPEFDAIERVVERLDGRVDGG